jgi:hypothetical protein
MVKINGQEFIRDHKTLLQIKIHHLYGDLYVPDSNEITLYGVGRDNLIAFQTIDRRAYDVRLVAFALAWYVEFTGQLDMWIIKDDPRVSLNLRRA